jgi:hypothetical protein
MKNLLETYTFNYLYVNSISESAEWFIADQTFSPSYDLAPLPLPLPPPPVSKLFRRYTGRLQTERQLAEGQEPNQTTAREPSPL